MRKRILLIGFVLALVALKAPLVRAQTTNVSAESITSYAVSLNLEQSGVLHVTEDITYDFNANKKHGIFRTIPLAQDGWPALDISVASVTSPADDSTYLFSTSEGSEDFTIKIGDPNVLVTGTKEYLIAYDVSGAVRSFSDHDELYWNAIGTEWSVPIANATAIVTLPADLPTGTPRTFCYTGANGSQAQDCTVSADDTGATINVSATDPLPPNNGLTVSVSVPKGFITNTVQQTAGSTGGYILNGAIPIIVFLIIFSLPFILIIWGAVRGNKKRALIPKELKHIPIAPYYNVPDNLPPAEIGYIENRVFDASDFTAIILDLAVRGFLKMTYIPKEGFLGREDYELTSLKPYDESLPPEYRPAYDLFFTGGTTTRVSSVDAYLGSKMLAKAGALVEKSFDDAGYLIKPKVGAFGKLILIFFIAAVVSSFFYLPAFLTFFGLAFISTIIAARKYKTKFTEKGIELMRKVLGFKMFLTLTETDRMKLMDAPKTSQESFEAVLPYAIALGIEKEWSKQFESITIQPPRWIEDSRFSTGFSAGVFVSSFGSFSSAMRSSTMVAGSGAGGGGSSGGGGGGGGGGSW